MSTLSVVFFRVLVSSKGRLSSRLITKQRTAVFDDGYLVTIKWKLGTEQVE